MNISKLKNIKPNNFKRFNSNVISNTKIALNTLPGILFGGICIGSWFCYAETKKQKEKNIINKSAIYNETVRGMILGCVGGIFGEVFYIGLAIYGGFFGIRNLIVGVTDKVVNDK